MENNARRAQALPRYGLGAVLILVLLAGAHAALCPVAQSEVAVPAVVTNQEGGLLKIRVSTQPGWGDVLTTVEPVTGPATQLSQELAVREAFRGLELQPDLCEVHFYIMDAGGAPSVDGPSAGMAMTLALRAALTNRTLRPDVSVTGAILPGGQVGQVGGIIDKAQASARGGLHAIITPKQELYENILLQRLGEERNFSAVEVDNLDEAMAILTSPESEPIKAAYHLQNTPVPQGLPPWPQNGQDRQFNQVAGRLNDMLRERLQEGGIFAKDGYGAYFQQQLDDNRRLASMGYGYTSANNAFLSQVDAAFLSLPAHEPDVAGEADRVLQCISRTPAVNLSRENFEWVAGGSARIAWSLQKIEDVKKNIAAEESSEDKYMALRDVYSAQAWCDAGTQLLLIGQQMGGEPVNDSELAALARSRLQAQARRIQAAGVGEDSDLAWHLQIANRSLMRKQWAAALFDAAYVEGSLDTADALENNQSAKASDILSTPLSSLWGRVYASQAEYLHVQAGSPEMSPDTQRVWRMALAMEREMGAGKSSTQSLEAGMTGSVAGGNPMENGSAKAAGGQAGGPKSLIPANLADIAVALVVLAAVLAIGVEIGKAVERFKKKEKRK
ncbi:Archaeal Lon protease [uncultured archaeon]|nr:Archaeal Lon protease [uncultured archaeon]